ncbi:hypothetical protein PPL_07680 [Heterostelium album PN500]|uniref:Ankyrin repeat protein n=1 Tax=Heterostelium pallidum (strain ATCC 26659 / Pp 5 / PN500) TaxID=670386 RepID=D3BGM8_HETP5|nr:hypothetical protein PPL_07680 [Heterostelium album PN500]EFA79262.1 hypothetical protein PPL_07680 [Heterostelium album PN500]|eukprot:XP_020431383.1 hypothetical protein PPL_07680 [Heterostelium album PN500]
MKKSLYSLVFKNSLICKYIFNLIHKICEKSCCRCHYSWSVLCKYPKALVGNNYLAELKDKDREITGNLEMFAYLLDVFSESVTREGVFRYYKSCNIQGILHRAAKYGRLDLIEYLLSRYHSFQFDYGFAMSNAPLSHDFQLLRFLVEKVIVNDPDNRDCSPRVFNKAAKMGRIDMIEYLLEQQFHRFPSSTMFVHAIKDGHKHVIEYLLKSQHHPLKNESHNLLDVTAKYDQLEIMKILFTYGVKSGERDPAHLAAKNGNIEMVKWIVENVEIGTTSKAFETAAAYGHKEIQLWLKENYCKSEDCKIN